MKSKFELMAKRLESKQFKKLWVEENFKTNHKEIMAEMPDYDKYLSEKEKAQANYHAVPLSWQFMYVEPFLDREQERHLFRKYNYLKYQFRELVEKGLRIRRIRKDKIIKGQELLRQIKELKQVLICSQGRLVMSLAKKNQFAELDVACSDGYYGLSMAVDWFDYRKGIRFTTYAWWVVKDAIRKNRIAEVEAANFHLTNAEDEILLTKPYQHDEEQADLREAIEVVLKLAMPRERVVLKYCFGIDSHPMTYEEVGEILQISKERVRQIKTMGLRRISSKTSPRLIYG